MVEVFEQVPKRTAVLPSGVKLDYYKYLKSPEWRKRKTDLLARNGRCEICYESKAAHLHHVSYVRLGHEMRKDLALACKSCHERIHAVAHARRIPLWRATREVRRAKGVARDKQHARRIYAKAINGEG